MVLRWVIYNRYKLFSYVIGLFVVGLIVLKFGANPEEENNDENVEPISAVTSTIRTRLLLTDISVLVRTYWKQAPFLPYMLLSIAKHWPQPYPNITLVYPVQDAKAIEHHLNRFLSNVATPEALKRSIHLYPVKDFLAYVHRDLLQGRGLLSPHRIGYWDQQLWKMRADEIIADNSRVVMHIDCDCMLTRQLNYEDVFDPMTHLVRLFMTKYTYLPPTVPWKASTERLLGLQGKIAYEYMRCFPLTFPREAYSLTRARILAHNGMPLEHFMLSELKRSNMPANGQQPGGPPFPLSEFNLLGACMHHFYSDRMAFEELNRAKPDTCPIMQFPSAEFTVRGADPLEGFTAQEDEKLCATMGEAPGCI